MAKLAGWPTEWATRLSRLPDRRALRGARAACGADDERRQPHAERVRSESEDHDQLAAEGAGAGRRAAVAEVLDPERRAQDAVQLVRSAVRHRDGQRVGRAAVEAHALRVERRADEVGVVRHVEPVAADFAVKGAGRGARRGELRQRRRAQVGAQAGQGLVRVDGAEQDGRGGRGRTVGGLPAEAERRASRVVLGRHERAQVHRRGPARRGATGA